MAFLTFAEAKVVAPPMLSVPHPPKKMAAFMGSSHSN